MLKLHETLKFASLLSYTPKRWWKDKRLSDERLAEFEMSVEYMKSLKRADVQPDGLISIYDSVAKWCADGRLFPDFFSKGAVLMPIPGSSLTKPNTMWTSKMLAKSLINAGLGSSVATCISRVTYVQKSATSRPENRPLPIKHCETMAVTPMVTEPTSILLVDDVVTRGATFLGAACRVAESYPKADIKAFAAMRTVSDGDAFNGIIDPCDGVITLRDNGHSLRSP